VSFGKRLLLSGKIAETKFYFNLPLTDNRLLLTFCTRDPKSYFPSIKPPAILKKDVSKFSDGDGAGDINNVP